MPSYRIRVEQDFATSDKHPPTGYKQERPNPPGQTVSKVFDVDAATLGDATAAAQDQFIDEMTEAGFAGVTTASGIRTAELQLGE